MPVYRYRTIAAWMLFFFFSMCNILAYKKLYFIHTACVMQILPRSLGGGGLINQIKLLDQELWLANVNHIAGTTCYSWGIKDNMPASHSQQCDTSLQRGHPLCFFFPARCQQDDHLCVVSESRRKAWIPAKCLMLHFEGILSYKVLSTRSGGCQRSPAGMMSLSREYLSIPPDLDI